MSKVHRTSREDMQEVMGQDQTTASRPRPDANASCGYHNAANGGNHVVPVALIGIAQTTIRLSRERSGTCHAVHIQHYNPLAANPFYVTNPFYIGEHILYQITGDFVSVICEYLLVI